MTESVIIGDATLYLGDMAEILPRLSGIDAIVTDPPYGIGIAGNPVRQRHERLGWDAWPASKPQLDLILAAAREHIIWGGNYFDLPPTQRFLIWDKVQPEEFSLAMCEQAWTSLRGPAKLFRRHVVSYEKSHPTQKPVELMEWCLGYISGAVVCDPFAGVFTTGVACVRLGKRFIGIEREPAYFEVGIRRIEDAYRQGDMFRPAPAKAQQMAFPE